ncbi:MAG: sugar nucleotide-binding protein [Chitinophagaceae bacterium]|nr:sugar nucleotide-binding protein [Chitinophagaceae bacterium]
MKILITGANGFLPYYLIEQLLQKQYTVIATAINAYRGKIDNPLFTYMQMDFTNANEVNAVLNEFKPTHIVHAGAISKPDVCEENKSLADKINIEGTNILLDAAQKNNCKIYFY